MPYVFGYGSLVDRASLEASLGRPVVASDGPHPVRLNGFRRCWNVATPTSVRSDYRFTLPDGAEWDGLLGWLGVEQSPGQSAVGAAYRIEDSELAALDLRERSYERVDVTHLLDATVPGACDEPAVTYVPLPSAIERATSGGSDVLVMARYLRLLERGFRSLGAPRYEEHVRTLPPLEPFRVVEMTASPRDPSAPNRAVDPLTPTTS